MAPRKEKTEKASADDAPNMILQYLRKTNRPYSANDISANLHNKVTKAAAAKYLKDMHERKEIEGRASGKQIVYHCIQDPADTARPEELTAIDEAIKTSRADTLSLNNTVKELKSQLAALSGTLSTTELFQTLGALEEEKTLLLNRLGPLRDGDVKLVDEKEALELKAELVKWQGIHSRRERIKREMWKTIIDSLPDGQDEAEVRESLGLDD